jgi:hypothetical protein
MSARGARSSLPATLLLAGGGSFLLLELGWLESLTSWL